MRVVEIELNPQGMIFHRNTVRKKKALQDKHSVAKRAQMVWWTRTCIIALPQGDVSPLPTSASKGYRDSAFLSLKWGRCVFDDFVCLNCEALLTHFNKQFNKSNLHL